MGLSSKSKVISGLALVSAIVAGCGGGGGSSSPGAANSPPAGGFNEGSTTCLAASPNVLLSAQNVAPTGNLSIGSLPLVLGSCEQYEASIIPTKSATGFQLPGAPNSVVYFPGQTPRYEIRLPVLAAGDFTTVTDAVTLPGGVTTYSFGNLAGKSYQNILPGTVGAAAFAYDFRNTTLTDAKPFMDLNYSRFGLFSRFSDRTFGYYGGWAQGDSGLVPALPNGSLNFRGIMVGVVGPAANGGVTGVPAGFSSEVSVSVNFTQSNAPLVSITVGDFGFSANNKQIAGSPISPSLPVVNSSALDIGTKSLSASFTTNGISAGRIAGNFYGNPNGSISEFVGKVAFTTADGRNAVGAFGVRVPNGNTIVGP